MIKIGITGGIGSGKSMVSELFTVLGIPVYNSDCEAKRLMAESPLISSRLKQLLGNEAYTEGGLNRAYIARRVFQHSDLLNQLNTTVHPVVFSDFSDWCQRHAHHELLACESAIMYECGLDAFMNSVVLVNAPRELCIQRAILRSGATSQEVEERMSRQQPVKEKIGRADFVIENNNIQPLIPQVLSIISHLRGAPL